MCSLVIVSYPAALRFPIQPNASTISFKEHCEANVHFSPSSPVISGNRGTKVLSQPLTAGICAPPSRLSSSWALKILGNSALTSAGSDNVRPFRQSPCFTESILFAYAPLLIIFTIASRRLPRSGSLASALACSLNFASSPPCSRVSSFE